MVMRYVNRSHTGRCTTNRLPLGGGQRIIPLHEAMCEKCPDWRGTPRRSSICIDRRYVLRSHAMLQLYGNPRSRAMRCLWMLEEVGEPYQLIEKSTRTDELQSVEYIRLNPNANSYSRGWRPCFMGVHGHQPLSRAKICGADALR